MHDDSQFYNEYVHILMVQAFINHTCSTFLLRNEFNDLKRIEKKVLRSNFPLIRLSIEKLLDSLLTINKIC